MLISNHFGGLDCRISFYKVLGRDDPGFCYSKPKRVGSSGLCLSLLVPVLAIVFDLIRKGILVMLTLNREYIFGRGMERFLVQL